MDYKEKLRLAKEALNSGSYDKETIEYIFPELAESEDEKIRKSIIAIITNYVDNSNTFKPKMIAWLEKQKYHYNFRQSIQVGDQVTRNRDGELVNLSQLKRVAKPADKEQKPVEWSEEDEDNFKHLMDEIVCLGNSRNSADRLHYDRLIKFLDELKNRIQPREEWCDKDERMLDRLIAYFEKRVAFTDEDNPRYADWLKSLRPQSHWRPTEYDLRYLQAVVNDASNAASASCNIALRELLEQLKQL